MYRATLAGLGVLSLTVLGLASAVAQNPAHATVNATATTPAPSPVQHVVVIYQENHTFDDVLGQLCQSRPTPCDGYTGPVTFADGTTAANIVEPDIPPIVDHQPSSQALGLSNQWDSIVGCTTSPYSCIAHIDPANIPNLSALAKTFTVSDATFAVSRSASFGAHVTLGAGTIDGFAGYNPTKSTTGAKPGTGCGCPSRLDALWGPVGSPTYVPSCVRTERAAVPTGPVR